MASRLPVALPPRARRRPNGRRAGPRLVLAVLAADTTVGACGTPTKPASDGVAPTETPAVDGSGAAPAPAAADVAALPAPSPEAGFAAEDAGGVEEPVPDVPAADVPSPQSLGHLADVDPANDAVVGPPDPIPDCEALLAAAGVSWDPGRLPITRHANGDVCGVDMALKYNGGPSGIRWSPRPLVSCGMALAFTGLEAILQEEAERLLGSRVTRIEQGGTSNCRRIGRFPGMMSEHSYANAIDLKTFKLEDGRTVSVARHFGDVSEEPTTPEGRFLRQVAHRLYDEDVFSCVLTEFWDDAHDDHFHVDLARYRVDGSR